MNRIKCVLLIGVLAFLAACSNASTQEAATGAPSGTLSATSTAAPEAPAEATASPSPEPVESPALPAAEAAASQAAPATPETEYLPSIMAQPTPSPAAPGDFPDPVAAGWVPVATGLAAPIGIANAGDGSGRLFILEQAGRIQALIPGQAAPQLFLDISGRVGSTGSEQGLLGLAFHPQYSQNGYFYVNYTDLQGDTVIARFSVSAQDPNQADPDSEAPLLKIDQPFVNHNGGVLAFGPDGYLYAGLGDGGSGGDPLGNAQNLDTLLGKILRLDVNRGDPYGIPPDNPFAGGGGRPEIWAYGLRNPWRFAFDRLTGDLWIGDVGQGAFEEVDFQPAGASGGINYGWNILEGESCYQQAGCNQDGLTLPVAVYPTHAEGSCAITGGEVYRGSALPAWEGIYLFGDYCSGRVWGLRRDAQGAWQSKVLYENTGRITSFGRDEAGEVYLADHAGNILQLQPK